MSRPCTICAHVHRGDIDRRLSTGEPARAVARAYGVASSNVQRHRRTCAGIAPQATVARLATRANVALASLPTREELGGAYQALTGRIDEIVIAAKAQGSLAIAIQGLNSLRQNLDSLSRIAGHDTPGPAQVHVVGPLDPSIFVAALTAALPDADARLRFAQAMNAPIINGTADPIVPSASVPVFNEN
jgi:hypothetical protein